MGLIVGDRGLKEYVSFLDSWGYFRKVVYSFRYMGKVFGEG